MNYLRTPLCDAGLRARVRAEETVVTKETGSVETSKS